MRLSAAFLLLIGTVSAQRRRALFDAAKMEHLIEAEKNRMTVNGVAVESSEEIEAEVDAIVAMYEDNEGSEETNDDFNFDSAEYTVNDIEFFAAAADDESSSADEADTPVKVTDSKSAKVGKASRPRTGSPTYVLEGKSGKVHTKSGKGAFPTLSPTVSSSPTTTMTPTKEPTIGKAGKSEDESTGKAGKSEDEFTGKAGKTSPKSGKSAEPTSKPTTSMSPTVSAEPSSSPTTSLSPSTTLSPTMKSGKSEEKKKSGKSEEKKKSGKSEEKKKSGKSEEKKSGKSEEKKSGKSEKKKSGKATTLEPSFSPTFSPTLSPIEGK